MALDTSAAQASTDYYRRTGTWKGAPGTAPQPAPQPTPQPQAAASRVQPSVAASQQGTVVQPRPTSPQAMQQYMGQMQPQTPVQPTGPRARISSLTNDASLEDKIKDNAAGLHIGADGLPARWNVPSGPMQGRYGGGAMVAKADPATDQPGYGSITGKNAYGKDVQINVTGQPAAKAPAPQATMPAPQSLPLFNQGGSMLPAPGAQAPQYTPEQRQMDMAYLQGKGMGDWVNQQLGYNQPTQAPAPQAQPAAQPQQPATPIAPRYDVANAPRPPAPQAQTPVQPSEPSWWQPGRSGAQNQADVKRFMRSAASSMAEGARQVGDVVNPSNWSMTSGPKGSGENYLTFNSPAAGRQAVRNLPPPGANTPTLNVQGSPAERAAATPYLPFGQQPPTLNVYGTPAERSTMTPYLPFGQQPPTLGAPQSKPLSQAMGMNARGTAFPRSTPLRRGTLSRNPQSDVDVSGGLARGAF